MVSGATQSFANKMRESRGERGWKGQKEVAEKKDGESMNGSLGILQRQRKVSL